ncbi:MAG: hypothetical protein NVS4B7_16600 [Ktedonobacteraceae bacterium]
MPPTYGSSPIPGQGYAGDGKPQQQGHSPVPARNNPTPPPPSSQPQRGNLPAAEPYQKARVLIELNGKIIGHCPLNKPVLTVGRLSSNDVQVPNQRVSRLHAKICWENGMWLIEDAESLNGLVYQGHRVEKRILTHGDRIYIAPTAALQYEAMA